MKWRCEWCGKPHEENDPPCDNCGHGQFEEAVVRRTDLAESGERTTALVWVCTECGREHAKHNPPCSRCGNQTLEKERQRVDESELSAPGYFDLVTPGYVAAFAVALVLLTVFALGATGIVDVPGFGSEGVPGVDGVPGNATHTGAIPLATVEDRFAGELNSRLESTGEQRIVRDGTLDEVARYLNQQVVRTEYTDRTGTPEVDDAVREALGDVCDRDRARSVPVSIQPGGDGEQLTSGALGTELADAYLVRVGLGEIGGDQFGVDVHQGPDGVLFLVQVTC